MVPLPFQPRRQFLLLAIVNILLVVSFGLMASFFWLYPQKPGAFVSNVLFDLVLHVALFLALREDLRFGPSGIERLAGVRRQHIEYGAVREVELRSGKHQRDAPFLYLHTSVQRVPMRVRFDFYESGEGLKMLRILREHAPDARWNEDATRLLEGYVE